MCQKACLPAPKTVRVCMCRRIFRSRVEVRAVRKAVRVLAATNARGWPSGVRRVIVPAGEVELDALVGCGAASPESWTDAAVSLVEVVVAEDAAVAVVEVEAALSLRELELPDDSFPRALGDDDRGLATGDPDLVILGETGDSMDESVDTLRGRFWVDPLALFFDSARVTILTPMPVSERAGMKRVVVPFLFFWAMRVGWLVAQQPEVEASVAVE